MTNSPGNATMAADPGRAPAGWRWAPVWVLVFVALWPAPGYAEGVMVLGAVAAIVKLLLARFRGGTRLLSGPAWALTSVLFVSYWLPEAVSAFDAVDRGRAFGEAAVDLRYLPFLWLVAAAVANARGRRTTITGLGIIAAAWSVDALLQGLTGTSPLFWGLDSLKQLFGGGPMCPPEAALLADRVSGVLGPCNLKLGPVLASLSPFVLYLGRQRFGRAGWLVAAALMGMALLLAGSRASWVTFSLVLVFSGWRLLGWKRLLAVFVFGALALGVLTVTVPDVRERVQRTAQLAAADEEGVEMALSGRARIWGAALCMASEHPFNGIGARGFREAFAHCDPARGQMAAWGEGPAFHAHQVVLEVLAETGIFGLMCWLAAVALGWRAWNYAGDAARRRARPAMLALGVTLFPLNTHLAFYSTFWGGLTLMLAALYAGSLLARDAAPESAA